MASSPYMRQQQQPQTRQPNTTTSVPEIQGIIKPIFASDIVAPGIFYFALLDTERPRDVDAWWIVLRCPAESLPSIFRDSKERSSRAYPVFVLGRAKFVWIERNALYLLHPSQKAAYKSTPVHDEFSQYFDAAVGVARQDPLRFFEEEIADARDQFMMDCARMSPVLKLSQSIRSSVPRLASTEPARNSLFIPEGEASSGEEVDDIENIRSAYLSSRKRLRAASVTSSVSEMTTHRNSPRLSHRRSPLARSRGHLTPRRMPPPRAVVPGSGRIRNSLNSLPSMSAQEGPKIKTEAEEYQIKFGMTIKPDEKIDIVVGRQNRPYPTVRSAVDKSGVLSARIQQDPKYGIFIMHPDLTSAMEEDALGMLQFMQEGQYKPRVVVRSDGSQGTPWLENKHHNHDYCNELVRAGRLWGLAQRLDVRGFAAHIFHKMTGVQKHKYSNTALMRCAYNVFGEDGANGRDSRVPMEVWLIEMLADAFREIMSVKEEREMFWRLEQRTTRRMLVRDVFARCAEKYHSIGGIPVVIPDD